jgi:hypothetical protein
MISPGKRCRLLSNEGWRTAESYGTPFRARQQLTVTFPLDQLLVEDDGVVVRLSGKLPVRPTPAVQLAPLRVLSLAGCHDPARWRADALLPEAQARVRALAPAAFDASLDGVLGAYSERCRNSFRTSGLGSRSNPGASGGVTHPFCGAGTRLNTAW